MINAVLPVEKAQSFATTEMGSNVTIQPRRPVGRSFNTSPLVPPTSCASSMFTQNRPARAQFIHDTSPFEFLALKTATITVSRHKAKCVEDTDAAITVATMEQVRSLLWHQMSAMALSAGDVG